MYYARYLDWLVTTPLLLVDVLLICKLPLSSWFFAIFADVAMNLTGLFGGVLSGTYRYCPTVAARTHVWLGTAAKPHSAAV